MRQHDVDGGGSLLPIIIVRFHQSVDGCDWARTLISTQMVNDHQRIDGTRSAVAIDVRRFAIGTPNVLPFGCGSPQRVDDAKGI
jgi:hypothetical protein